MQVKKPVKSIEKAIDMLEYLIKENHPLSLSEISGKLGFPPATTHRLLNTFMYKNYICKTDNRYRLTLKLFGLNNLLFLNFHIHSAFRRYLQLLCDRVKLSVHFGIYDEGKVLLADVISSPLTLKVDVPPGTRECLHSTALGKILLAHMSSSEIEEVIREVGLPKLTDRTITKEEKLYSELAKTRKTGFAVDDEETTAGAKCVAVPIRDKHAKVLAALSVAGPASQIPEGQVPEFVPILEDVAEKIGNLINELTTTG